MLATRGTVYLQHVALLALGIGERHYSCLGGIALAYRHSVCGRCCRFFGCLISLEVIFQGIGLGSDYTVYIYISRCHTARLHYNLLLVFPEVSVCLCPNINGLCRQVVIEGVAVDYQFLGETGIRQE